MNRYTLRGILILLGLWAIVSGFSLIDRRFLATPWDITLVLVQLSLSGQLFRDMLYTILRCVVSFTVSAVIGVPIGLLIGWSKKLRDYFSFPVEFFRALPAPVLFPLFIVLFGIGNLAKVAGAVFACSLPIVIQTAYGVINCNHRRIKLMERMGLNRTQILLKVIFPMALPYIFVGLRNALSLALIATIVVEMTMPGSNGLGYGTLNAYQTFRVPQMYAYILITGMVGWILNAVFLLIERDRLRWVQD